ncbi:MAG: penicillin-binding transpeptidase domain-containing protein, partial [Oscillospiraceae bacterium]
LVTLAAAIEEIPSLYEMSFECRGSVNVGGDQINCTGVHGMQTIEDALANSCNCAFSELSQKLGGETIEKYAEDFGLLKSHKISGIETAAGSFEKAEQGSSNLSWAGIGQFNDLVTPISMLRLVSAIANEGYVKEPTLLKQGSTGKTKLMTSETAEKIRDMMSYNVAKTYGAQNYPNLNLCAKSGTAELGDGSSNAWFVGFLNDSENPLAFTIIVERGGTGFVAAGPIANAVLQAAVAK